MPAYQVWLLNDNYSKFMYLGGWLKLAYRVGLNQMCGACIDLKANDPKIETIALMKRLLILRDGVVVWGGLLQTEGWVVEGSAPTGDTYFLDALDYAAYLDWRTIPRPDGEDYDWYEDHADNVAKAIVRNHLGVSALAARQFSDLTVAADVSAVASCQRSLVAGTVLERLIALVALKHFYWRIVPGAAGCTFTTYYPLAGLDRTRGNGVNDEIVFTPDQECPAHRLQKGFDGALQSYLRGWPRRGQGPIDGRTGGGRGRGHLQAAGAVDQRVRVLNRGGAGGRRGSGAGSGETLRER